MSQESTISLIFSSLRSEADKSSSVLAGFERIEISAGVSDGRRVRRVIGSVVEVRITVGVASEGEFVVRL